MIPKLVQEPPLRYSHSGDVLLPPSYVTDPIASQFVPAQETPAKLLDVATNGSTIEPKLQLVPSQLAAWAPLPTATHVVADRHETLRSFAAVVCSVQLDPSHRSAEF
jgi:hypothetical protein